MATSKLFKLTAFLVTLGIVVFCIRLAFRPTKFDFAPYRADGYYGSQSAQGKPKADDAAIRPFTLNISDEELTDLRDRFADHFGDSRDFRYGFNSRYLRDVVIEHWRHRYDWRDVERRLNAQMPSFVTQIEGLDIHFVHVRASKKSGSVKTILPVMLLHGWPGSFYEFNRTIPLLTQPDSINGIAFDVVVPSIPGFGYSEAPHRPGFMVTRRREYLPS